MASWDKSDRVLDAIVTLLRKLDEPRRRIVLRKLNALLGWHPAKVKSLRIPRDSE